MAKTLTGLKKHSVQPRASDGIPALPYKTADERKDYRMMEINNTTDLELSKMSKAELETLQKYEEMFDDMTYEEKYALNQWLVNGHSVSSNGHYLYGENGCPLDFISASRMIEDMVQNPDQYQR